MKRLAIFASGSGTNAENLIRYFSNSPDFEVVKVFCNKPDAFGLQRAAKAGVPSVVFTKKEMADGSLLAILQENEVDAIILAGFLLKIPDDYIELYPNRIINIHPALLPKYGGKGMHGMHVHQAVVEAHEKESGITIHLVDNQYDHGKILFQAKCEVLPCDSAMDVAAKIHLLEQEHFPGVVDDYLQHIFY